MPLLISYAPVYDLTEDHKSIVRKLSVELVSLLLNNENACVIQTPKAIVILAYMNFISDKYGATLDAFYNSATMLKCLTDTYYSAITYFISSCLNAALNSINSIEDIHIIITNVYKHNFISTSKSNDDLPRVKMLFACHLSEDIIMPSHIDEFIEFLIVLYECGDIIASIKKVSNLRVNIQIAGNKKFKFTKKMAKFKLSDIRALIKLCNTKR